MHRFDKKLKPFAAVIHQLRSFITLYKTMNSVNLNKYSKDERSPFELTPRVPQQNKAQRAAPQVFGRFN